MEDRVRGGLGDEAIAESSRHRRRAALNGDGDSVDGDPWAALVAAAVAHARACWPDEVCGLVYADRVEALRNVLAEQAHEGRRAFRLADREQLRLARAMDGDAPPLALYHSHPRGDAWPSARDVRAAFPTGDGTPLYASLAWLIVAPRRAPAEPMPPPAGAWEARLFRPRASRLAPVDGWLIAEGRLP